jgi:hypothetical protein
MAETLVLWNEVLHMEMLLFLNFMKSLFSQEIIMDPNILEHVLEIQYGLAAL